MGVLPAETVLRILIVMFVLPLLCGSFFAARLRRYEGRGFLLNAYLFGWIAIFVLFELICTPYVVMLGKFSDFYRVFNVFVLCAAVISGAAAAITLYRSEKRTDKNETAAQEKTAWWAWLLWMLVIASVLAQMVFFYFYNHMNGDDSYYVAQSVITDLVDTMFQRDAYTGTPMGLDVRHALAVLPVFVTWLARVCGLHAATAAHAVWGPVLLAVCYGAYALVGKALFAKNRNAVPVFVLFVQAWYLFGNVSIFTPETFLYTRTWQGKAVFANIILPIAFYLLYRVLTEWKTIYIVLLMMLSVAGIFTTTASVYLLTALYGITALYCLFTQKSFRKCLNILLCAAPAFVYGLLYLWLLRTW